MPMACRHGIEQVWLALQNFESNESVQEIGHMTLEKIGWGTTPRKILAGVFVLELLLTPLFQNSQVASLLYRCKSAAYASICGSFFTWCCSLARHRSLWD